jgi:hypothetical protein
MIPGITNAMLGSLGGAVVTHRGTYFSITDRDRSAYTFTVDLGPATPNRLIVATMTLATENFGQVTSATLGGAAMNLVEFDFYRDTDTGSGSMYSIVSGTGSSASLVINQNGRPTYSIVVDVFSITGLTNTSTFSSNSANNGTTSLSTTINVPDSGVIIASGGGWRTVSPYTWTGVNKVSELASGDGGAYLTSGMIDNQIQQTNKTISWTSPSASRRSVILAASWR